MGHKDIKTTLRYVENDSDEAIEVYNKIIPRTFKVEGRLNIENARSKEYKKLAVRLINPKSNQVISEESVEEDGEELGVYIEGNEDSVPTEKDKSEIEANSVIEEIEPDAEEFRKDYNGMIDLMEIMDSSIPKHILSDIRSRG